LQGHGPQGVHRTHTLVDGVLAQILINFLVELVSRVNCSGSYLGAAQILGRLED
jgi:hypothetical protein